MKMYPAKGLIALSYQFATNVRVISTSYQAELWDIALNLHLQPPFFLGTLYLKSF